MVLFLGRSVKKTTKNEQVVNCLGILENLRVNPTGEKRRKYYIHFYTAILYIHYILKFISISRSKRMLCINPAEKYERRDEREKVIP